MTCNMPIRASTSGRRGKGKGEKGKAGEKGEWLETRGMGLGKEDRRMCERAAERRK